MIYITNESELKMGKCISAIYFYSDWLIFHKKMKIMIEKTETAHPDLKFYAVDIDDFKNVCRRFNITSIPTIIIMEDDGKEVKRINGVTLTSSFRKTFRDIYEAYGENNAIKKENQPI